MSRNARLENGLAGLCLLLCLFVLAMALYKRGEPWIIYKYHKTVQPSHVLSSQERSELAPKAEAGDGDAAMRLVDHYDLATYDRSTASHYLDLAVKAGNPRALQIKKHRDEVRAAAPEKKDDLQ